MWESVLLVPGSRDGIAGGEMAFNFVQTQSESRGHVSASRRVSRGENVSRYRVDDFDRQGVFTLEGRPRRCEGKVVGRSAVSESCKRLE